MSDQRQFQYCGEYYGGPFDGIKMYGCRLPETVTVDLGIVQILVGGEKCPPDPVKGFYDSFADFLHAEGRYIALDDIVGDESYDDWLDKAEFFLNDLGEPVIFIYRVYQWVYELV